MDPVMIGSAYSSIKAAKDIFTFLLSQKIDTEVKAKIIEAQHAVGDAQDAMFALREHLSSLQSQIFDLQRKVEESETWSSQLSKYELQETPGGAHVYQSVSGVNHYISPSCIAKKQLQILQKGHPDYGMYLCPACKINFQVQPERQLPSINYDSSY